MRARQSCLWALEAESSSADIVVAPPHLSVLPRPQGRCHLEAQAQLHLGTTQRAAAGWYPGYSLHEFTRRSLRAESNKVVHTNDSPGVPMPTQGTCKAGHSGCSDSLSVRQCLSVPLQSEPCSDCLRYRGRVWLQMSYSQGTVCYPLHAELLRSASGNSVSQPCWEVLEK